MALITKMVKFLNSELKLAAIFCIFLYKITFYPKDRFSHYPVNS